MVSATTSYTLLLIAMGLIWVLATLLLRGKIKKLWLYALFPTAIYSAPAVYLAYSAENYYCLAALAAIYSYYSLKLIREFSLRDAILVPLSTLVVLAYLTSSSQS